MITFVFDGSCMLYRAGYTNMSGGESTWGGETLSTFLSYLRSPLFTYMPDRAYLVWDGGHSERRTSLHAGYKKTASRERTDEEKAGFARCRGQLTKIVKRLGVRVVTIPGKEADDVIGKIAVDSREKDRTVVVSTDSDFLQLVKYGVHIYDFANGVYVCEANFEEIVGVKPSQFLVYKSLVGDSSDNIKGVPQIGEVTAKTILTETKASSVHDLSTYLNLGGSISIPDFRLKKLVDGFDVLVSNLELIDLMREPFTAEEAAMIKSSDEREVVVDESVIEELSSLGVTTPARLKENWLLPFYQLR